MGALASHDQVEDVQRQVDRLLEDCDVVFGEQDGFRPVGDGAEHGAFFSPTLLAARDPHKDGGAHDIEAFGPVATLMAYDDLDEAMALTAKGKGGLVATLTTHDPGTAAQLIP